MNKRVIIFLIIGIIIGVSSSYILLPRSTGLEDRIKELEETISEREVTITALQSQINELNNEITRLNEKIAKLEQQIEVEILGIYFSPKGECEQQVIYWISRANSSIHILIYSFTSDPIGDALVNAHNRGIEIKVVFEKSQVSKYSEYFKLKEAGIEVRNDTNPKLMHHKVMIIDQVIVLTGSYNWSYSAENNNNENLIIIKSKQIAIIYETEFQKIWNQSG
ncbi:MAG: phospholipase D-like domain-containing protein [archaeon GB-1867-035]|nr:phospholipase D-like domain-containing protein [Candidatus Culexmicrobium profundum]